MKDDELSFLRSGNAPILAVEPQGISEHKYGFLDFYSMQPEEVERTRNSEGHSFVGMTDVFDRENNK